MAIALPESLVVKRSTRTETRLTDKAREWLAREERTPGIHASDVLDERLAFWQRVDPQPIPDRLVNMFLVGKILHSFVIDAVVGESGASDAGTSTSAELGIEYSPDLLVNGVVREVKTTRSFFEPKDPKVDLSLYLEQLAVYLAATDTLVGQLWILYLNLRDESGKTAPAFRCYTVTLDAGALADVKAAVKQRADSITAAIAAVDHTRLPICRPFKCGRANCGWWDKCRPEGRFGVAKWEKS